ncbi:MAG: hypothetical protein LBT59_05660 [Clostridiales bacterium]|nr:hypothetical protein [Clostridiales bacterium]
MQETLKKLLSGKEESHILPFLWLHGEDEETLRSYVNVIRNANIFEFCVESRPHPDFCGPKWWIDLEAIIDEAQKLEMKVWILDDAHFPTGYANGAVENAPEELCRQSICANRVDGTIPPPFVPNMIEKYMQGQMGVQRHFEDDQVIAVNVSGETTWTIGLSRNCGFHRNYIKCISQNYIRGTGKIRR